MSKWNKQPRPYAQRGQSLWGGCLFALPVGWPHGARAPDPGTLAEVDDQSQSRGVFSSSIDPTHWDVTDAGWMLDSDGTSDEVFRWTDVGGKFAIVQGFTAAVLVRPTTVDVTAPTFHGVFSKVENDASFTNRSWSIHQDSSGSTPNNWRGQFTDTGLTDRVVDSGVVPSVNRTDLIVLRYDRVGGQLQIWVNGILRASLAIATAVLNNSAWPLGLARPEVSSTSTWKAGMLGLWNRPIVQSEIAALNTDPFCMWSRRRGDLS